MKVRRRLQATCRKEAYAAAHSLAEGLEETLTLHRLGVAGELGCRLRTTNLIENINSRLGARTRRVTRRVNSDQRQRWIAMAIRETEPRLRKLPGAEPLRSCRRPWRNGCRSPMLSPPQTACDHSKSTNSGTLPVPPSQRQYSLLSVPNAWALESNRA